MLSRRTLGLALLGVLLGGAGLYWYVGFDLTAWWRLRALAAAGDADRDICAERVGELDGRALPGLVALLRRDDAAACRNARAGLVCLARHWPGAVAALGPSYANLSAAGQAATLRAAHEVGPAAECPDDCRAAWAQLLAAVPADAPEEVRGAALDLAGWLLTGPGRDEALATARTLLRSCLAAQDPAVRLRAVELSAVPGLEAFEQVVGLLRDPAVEVRRAAVIVVGPADKAVLDETLLPCLRDPDAEVQRLCEAALRGRGLTPAHLKLCRLLIDPAPRERLKVLDHLAAADLEPGVWLRRLSHDPADSVRAAAVRVMAVQKVDLSDRLEQMSSSDPSPTVSALAAYYLDQARQRGD